MATFDADVDLFFSRQYKTQITPSEPSAPKMMFQRPSQKQIPQPVTDEEMNAKFQDEYIAERDREIKQILHQTKDVKELFESVKQIPSKIWIISHFFKIAQLVETQADSVDSIASNIVASSSSVKKARKEIEKADEEDKSTIAYWVGGISLASVATAVVTTVLLL